MTEEVETLRHESARDAVYDEDMKSRIGPLGLIAGLFAFIFIAVAGFWLVSLPSRMLASLQEHVRLTGLELTAESSALSFSDGPGAELQRVKVKATDASFAADVARITFSAAWPWSNSQLIIEEPFVTYRLPVPPNISGASKSGLLGANPPGLDSITVLDGKVRVADGNDLTLYLVDELNTQMGKQEDGYSAQGRAQVNGVRTVFKLELDDAARLLSDGTPSDLYIASAEEPSTFDLQYSGRLRFSQGLSLDGRISSAAEDATPFLKLLGLPTVLPVSGALAAEGGVSVSGERVALSDLTLTQGSTEASGKFAIMFGRDTNRIDGMLQLPKLTVSLPVTSGPWSDRPLTLPNAGNLEGEVSIQAERLQAGPYEIAAPKLSVLFSKGTTTYSMNANSGEELLEARLEADSRGEVPAFKLDASLRTKTAERLLPALTGFSFLSGAGSAKFNLQSSGRTAAEVVANASGTISGDLQNNVLKGVDLGVLLSGNSTGWNPAESSSTKPIYADFSLTVEDGIATLSKPSLKANNKDYAVKGEVDLLRKAIALDVIPKGGKRVGLFGPWQAPEIGPDVTGAPQATPPAERAAVTDN